MSKILGVDYGTRRVGLSISDSSKIIAFPLCTVKTEEIYSFIDNIINVEKVGCIVIGTAINLDGSDTDSSQSINLFVKKLTKHYNDIEIVTSDERFTSKIAKSSIVNSGLPRNKRRDKSLVDKISATIILQDYLTYK